MPHPIRKPLKKIRKRIDTKIVINTCNLDSDFRSVNILGEDPRFIQILVEDTNGRMREIYSGEKWSKDKFAARPDEWHFKDVIKRGI